MDNRKIGVSEIPKSIDTKFSIGDYISDVTPRAKIQSDRPAGRPRN